MANRLSKIGRWGALAACATMLTTPLAAQPLAGGAPLTARPAPSFAWSPADDVAEQRRWRHRRHRDGNGNDVLGALLVLGGVAAVAAAIDKSDDEQRERRDGYRYRERGYQRDYGYEGDDRRYDDRRYDERGYDERRYGARGAGPAGADRAVSACSAEAGRSGRVDEILDVDQVDGEWRVRGDFADGRGFTCTIDSRGRAYVGLGDRAELDAANERYAAGLEEEFDNLR